MKKILSVSLLLMTCILYAQSPSKNYIKTKVYKVAHRTETDPLTSKDTLVNITYFNGLGQPIQSIALGAGGNGQDIVTPIKYENGRKTKSYLPYVDTRQLIVSPNYRDNDTIIASLNNYYVSKFPDELSATAPNPFSEVALEASPFERAYKTSAPGEAWKLNNTGNDRSIKSDIYLNEEEDNVFYFKVNFLTENGTVHTDTTSLTSSGYYTPGKLIKSIIRNENWDGNYDNHDNTSEEYTDDLGHLVLKRTFNLNEPHDTYYVYDDFGNLTYVIPPLASDQILNRAIVSNQYGINSSWYKLVVADQELADEYEKALEQYNSPTVLAADLLDKYGATGGFSVVPDANGNLVLSINIQTNDPMPYRKGEIADLAEIGKFSDMEIGRIESENYEYIFTVASNKLVVSGTGKVPSINVTLTSGEKLSYSKNYHWSEILELRTEDVEKYYDSIKGLPNEQLNITYIENDLGALGGISLSIDEQDDVSFSININAASKFAFKTGNIFPLDISRSISDRILGIIEEDGYGYKFSIKNNFLVIVGEGELTNINLTSNKPGTRYLVNQKPLQGLCYIYHYDQRNRQIEKHVPEKGWTQTVYDKLNRPVLVQDENLRIKTTNNWLYTKYDIWNRVAYTGEYSDARSRKVIQKVLDTDTTTLLNETRLPASAGILDENKVLYTQNAFPTTGTKLTVNYYDDYEVNNGRIMPSKNLYNDDITTNVKSLPTCTKTLVLGAPNKWEVSTFYYEDRGMLISTAYSNQYFFTSDAIDQHINFAGQILASKRRHIKNGTTLTVEDLYTYNHVGQVLKQTEKINGGTEQLIAFNKYNELGTLIEKKVGGTPAATYDGVTASLQTIKYSYTLRGWLKGINNPDNSLATTPDNDLFAFKLNYNTTDFTGSEALYNGNIAESVWRSKTDNKKRGYSYHYDPLNRLIDANYVGNHELALYPGQTENYTEGAISYDKQGNILHLERYGLKVNTIDKIDELTYTYMPFSNKLLGVSDAASSAGFDNGATGTLADYNYDLNGNLNGDAQKRITSITYNYLDLPVTVKKSSDVYVTYTYTATGGKIQKKYSDGVNVTLTQYANGFVYQNGVLQYFPHAEGYVQKDSNGNFTYVYQYKDHLGNVRLSYFKNGSGALEVVEEENYYAFGMKHQGYNNVTSSNSNDVAQKVEFNGKELQEELSLNWYDYGARNYDPTIGRWFNVDPLAEKYRRWTPYNYCMNNPVFFIDPDGMKSIGSGSDYNWETGQYRSGSVDAALANIGAEYTAVDEKTSQWLATMMDRQFKVFFSIGDSNSGSDSLGSEENGLGSATKTKLHYEDIVRIYEKMTSGVEYNGDQPNPKYMSPEELFSKLAGPILDLYNADPDQFHNTCAVRLSFALNEAGYLIPKSAPGVYLAADGKYIIPSATSMYKYLSKTYEMKPGSLQSSEVHNGIVVQSHDGNRIDHVDVFLRQQPANRSYYSNVTYIFKSDN